jgi:hypothetical protein
VAAVCLLICVAHGLTSGIHRVGCDALLVRLLTEEGWDSLSVVLKTWGRAICAGALVVQSGLRGVLVQMS